MGDFSLANALRSSGIRDERVLTAMALLRRADFVPADVRHRACFDAPLPIGHGQTISQPYVVARMTEALELGGQERVLEIGTSSGYQTAVLAALCRAVFSVEIVDALAERAKERLSHLRNVHLRRGDGRQGWPEAAPFDAILVTAAPDRLPDALIAQLEVGGRLVAPVGPPDDQMLVRIRRLEGGDAEVEHLFPVRFVPLTSRQWLQ